MNKRNMKKQQNNLMLLQRLQKIKKFNLMHIIIWAMLTYKNKSMKRVLMPIRMR